MKKLFILFFFLLVIAGEGYAISASGGTVTTVEGKEIHTFTSGGTFTISGTGWLNCEILIVAGGGGGGNANYGGGGGGAGGLVYVASSNMVVGDYSATVGGGGGAEVNGNNSVFISLTATGGGAGKGNSAGANGGCGGGANGGANVGGTGSQGGNGGKAYFDGTASHTAGGGGGGNAANGADGTSAAGGNGGNGTAYSVSGSSVTYAGGGGGASYAGTHGSGGSGGGGNAGASSGNNGTANTGGGGGASGASGSGGSGGSGIVIIRILGSYPLPSKTTTPSPASGATGQATNLTLSWVNGGDATSYNVNFGVSNSMTARGNQAGITYIPPGVLTHTDYQWRIDAVNAQGTTTGDTWNFRTINPIPVKATTPSPANHAVNQVTNLTLSWVNGGNALSYYVYFGLSNSLVAKGNQAGTTYVLSGVTYNTNYQWRIDATNIYGDPSFTTGDTWDFATTNPVPRIATNPSPANGVINQLTTKTLTWNDAGAGTVAAATNYQVYWGLNGAMTNNAYTATASYTLPTLLAGSNYQWRITSFNGNGSPNVITGTVWNFTTANNEITTTGGTVTTNGNYIIHKFTGNGTFGVNGNVKLCEVLCVAGGGHGGGGGGGGGGFLSNGVYQVTNGTIAIVGIGGSPPDHNSSNSVFGTNIAIAGGNGTYGVGAAGSDGGSGSGGNIVSGIGGLGTVGQGNNGGNGGPNGDPSYASGGGGGASQVGYNGDINGFGGSGGDGKISSISGTTEYYAGGGGGVGQVYGGYGGNGGGGKGGNGTTSIGDNGAPTTGGGGGGGGNDPGYGGNGGSGIVIVRYDDSFNLLKAINPVPSDDSADADLGGVILGWQDGGGGTNFHVYFGLEGAMTNSYNGTATNYVTGALEKGKTYQWRVDTENASATIEGTTWSFHSLFYIIPHRINGVVDNKRVFGVKGKLWGK